VELLWQLHPEADLAYPNPVTRDRRLMADCGSCDQCGDDSAAPVSVTAAMQTPSPVRRQFPGVETTST
jgi:hypothetical protein